MRFFVYTILLIASLALLGRHAYFSLNTWSTQPVQLSSAQVLTLEKGMGLTTFSESLARDGIVDSALRFRLWVRLFSDYTKFQAGQYQFVDEITPASIASMVSRGEIFTPVVLEVTIPEGFTVRQIVQRLLARGVGTAEQFESLTTSKVFRATHNIPAPTLEGYLYPATYQFSEMPTPEQALTKMVQTFWEKLPADYSKQLIAKGLTLEQGVIFASLIELETPHEDEKTFVSEVIWRRLKDRTTLAIDAAIIYGIKDYSGDIRTRDLRDKSNAYNTRVHRGLPPTAIGSPSRSSLEAVLQPSDRGYYFYVVDADSLEKRHHFSKTLSEHNRYVRKLIRKKRAR